MTDLNKIINFIRLLNILNLFNISEEAQFKTEIIDKLNDIRQQENT